MDDGGFSPNSYIFGDIDIDFMDQLLDEGCWLQTADGSKFLQSPPSTSEAVGFHSDISLLPPQQDAKHQEGNRGDLASTEKSPIDLEAENNLGPQSLDQNGIQSEATSPQLDLLLEGSEQNRIWLAPKADAGPSSSVKDRLMMAVRNFQALTRERDLLIQIWVPVTRGINNFLTTVEQPYSYDPDCAPLVHYRNVSEGYHFCADEDSKEGLGLPGRVFLGKFPEWTPDVRLFRLDEYPRVNYALMCDVRGSVALPVFDSRSGSCLGVVEIVTTTQKINYRPEVESVCRALEAVNLRSSEIISPFKEKVVEIDAYDIELSEISRIIRTICDKHGLPLGQIWAPCTQHKKGGCWRLDNNTICMSTIDSACYVHEKKISGFHEACCEQHLFQEQGIVGKAFRTNRPCYVVDVTEYSKGQYPLSHHAKMFGLRGALTMHLRCLYGGLRSYVVEFFLPIDCHDLGLTFHSEIMESLRMEVQGCQSLSFDGKLGGEDDERAKPLSSEKPTQEDKSWIPELSDAQKKGKGIALPFDFGKDELTADINVSTHKSNNEEESCNEKINPGSGNSNQESVGTGIFEGLDGSIGDDCSLGAGKKGEKKSKTQKSISLEVLKQYFSGSLKDAAKSIGVCPTTLKRVCRQHGITRWPSRKIKKVDHSLRKLQHVIDSVQGAQGSIKISSFYSKFPELKNPKTEIKDHEGSSSQTSSSNSIAAGAKTSLLAANASGSGDPTGCITRARSEAQLDVLDQNTSTVLERCLSNKSLTKHPSVEKLPSLEREREGRKPGPRDGLTYKVKANFGEDKIRLKLAPNMGFKDLQRGIAARLSIGDVSWMQIKYLDDDNEWVLLTCDDDLEECVDIQRSQGSDTVRLLVHQATLSLGSSFGSSGKS